jgi:hypothetical protein
VKEEDLLAEVFATDPALYPQLQASLRRRGMVPDAFWPCSRGEIFWISLLWNNYPLHWRKMEIVPNRRAEGVSGLYDIYLFTSFINMRLNDGQQGYR